MSSAMESYLVTPADDADHSLGPADAPVTVIEYADFECLHCARVHPTLKQLRDEIPDAFRLIFRHFPLVADHPRAVGAARAAAAAGRQGKFWAMHDKLLEHQAYLSPDAFRLHAEDLGLDLDRFASDLVDPSLTARIERDMVSGRATGVRGTPTFFVNGTLYVDSGDPGLLRRAILAAATEALPVRPGSTYRAGRMPSRPREEIGAV